MLLTVDVCLELGSGDPSNYLYSTDVGVKWCSFPRMVQIKKSVKFHITHHRRYVMRKQQKLLFGIINSGTWVKVWTQNICSTLWYRSEERLSLVTGKKNHKIYTKPLGKLKLLWVKLYGCCMCCCTSAAGGEAKLKVTGWSLKQHLLLLLGLSRKLILFLSLPSIFLIFKLWRKISVHSKQRNRWGNILLLLHNLLLGFDWIIHFMLFTPWIGLLKGFGFYQSLRIFLPGLRFSAQLFPFLVFSSHFSSFICTAAYIKRQRDLILLISSCLCV